jgi:uncharacterized membrane protein YccF (DUF307 family)
VRRNDDRGRYSHPRTRLWCRSGRLYHLPSGDDPLSTREQGAQLRLVLNIIWFILAGWWLALGHLFTGILLCLTIIGIPLGIANFKIAGAALVPFGKDIVSVDDLRTVPKGAIVVGDKAAT